MILALVLLLVAAVGAGVAGVAIALRRSRATVETRVGALAAGLGYTTELAASLDLDDVLDRTIDTAVALPDVDAALIVLGSGGEGRTIAAAGLTDEEIERTILQMPAHPDLRAIEVVYRYRLEDASETSKLPRAALTVALRADGEAIGSLAVVTRSGAASLPAATADAVDSLARRAGPAIANARHYAEAREQAELDSLTGLRNRRLFYDFLSREIARAQRYDHSVSLIVFDLDDFKRINDRIGHLGGDAVLAEVAERIRRVVRSTDIACRVGGDEFAVILPEASREDAELLADRIAHTIRGQKIAKAGALTISTGVAELHPGDTAADVFTRADEAMYRGKHAGKARSAGP